MIKNKNIKIAFSAAMILVLILSLTACNNDSLKEYKEAVMKTEKVEKGRTSGEISAIMDFNTENMTPEDIKNLNYYKDIEASFNASYDGSLNKGVFRNYLNLGGLGFDFDLYQNGDEMFAKLPVLGKYMKLDDMVTSMEDNEVIQTSEAKGKEIISEESVKALSQSWLNLMNKDDVFKGKNIIIETPDGEVKSTEYTISLSDEQIKKLFSDGANILSNDTKFKEFYQEFKNNIKPFADKTFEEMVSDLKGSIESYEVNNFSYTAYVDIDGYIVEEKIKVELKAKNDDSRLKNVSFSYDLKNWDINKEQSFEFPTLTDENTVTSDDMKNGGSSMFEELFKNAD